MKFAKLPLFLFILITISSIAWSISWRGLPYYTEPYFTEKVHKNLENMFNHSQYRLKNPTSLIPDETVFTYAASAYIRGTDPILINSEHTPLGKYFIGLSIVLFRNDRTIMIFFAALTLFSIWLISKMVLGDTIAALVPVGVFAFEQLFMDQLRYVPLQDIIQLPFIFFALTAFLVENKKRRYFWTAILLGFVMAIKTIVPAILLVGVFIVFYILRKRIREMVRLFLWLPLSLIVFLLAYTRTFMSGYSIGEFIGFQKWIFLYQKSKLLFPFSAWRLVYFNQWQAWWGDFSILKADDWRVTWAIGTTLTAVYAVFSIVKKIRWSDATLLLFLWTLAYAIFLSLGVVSSRFFLPYLPVVYILSTAFVVSVAKKNKRLPRRSRTRSSQ